MKVVIDRATGRQTVDPKEDATRKKDIERINREYQVIIDRMDSGPLTDSDKSELRAKSKKLHLRMVEALRIELEYQ